MIGTGVGLENRAHDADDPEARAVAGPEDRTKIIPSAGEGALAGLNVVRREQLTVSWHLHFPDPLPSDTTCVPELNPSLHLAHSHT